MDMSIYRTVAGLAVGAALSVAGTHRAAADITIIYNVLANEGSYAGQIGKLQFGLADDAIDLIDFGADGVFLTDGSAVDSFSLTFGGATVLSYNDVTLGSVSAYDNFFQDGGFIDRMGIGVQQFENPVFDGKFMSAISAISLADTDTFGQDLNYSTFMNEATIEGPFDGSGYLFLSFTDGTSNQMTLLSGTEFSVDVRLEWAAIGNAGNVEDPTTGSGAVGYEFQISSLEVTNAQYAAFLNAVAASDPNGLYNVSMGADAHGGIDRAGSEGGYTYLVKDNMGNKPVNFVSWYDAARFCNWITNGQESGDTESGVYTLTGPTSISDITRDPSDLSQVFLPTDDEWYKAAFHQPASEGGDTDDYWLFATGSNSEPVFATAATNGDVSNPGPEVVNYFRRADWNGLDGNVTTVGSAGSISYYGVFDLNGNVWEWNETLRGSSRGLRGGSFDWDLDPLHSWFNSASDPVNEQFDRGFRVASFVEGSACVADYNGDTVLDIFDITAFLADFSSSDSAADWNGDTLFDIFDVTAYLAAFDQGC